MILYKKDKMKTKVNKDKFDAVRASEQFEQYKETGSGRMPKLNPNKLGYSDLYAEGWERIFGKEDDNESAEEAKTS